MRPRLDPSRLSDLDKRLFARVDEEAADAAARGRGVPDKGPGALTVYRPAEPEPFFP